MNRREGRKGERNVIRQKRVLVQNYTTFPKIKATPKEKENTMWNARSTYPSLPSQEVSWPGAPSKCQAFLHHKPHTHETHMGDAARANMPQTHTATLLFRTESRLQEAACWTHNSSLSGPIWQHSSSLRDTARRNTTQHDTTRHVRHAHYK